MTAGLNADVVVVGGGSMGCATAAHLLRIEPGLDVVVLEPDPTYAEAASVRASGGVRQLFTRPENIQLSKYTLDLIDAWADPELAWRPNGYLFIAPKADADALERNLRTQLACGVDAEWIDVADLPARFPGLAADDLGGAVLSPRDGWLDPHAFLRRLRREAAELGATFVADRAMDLAMTGGRASRVELASGDSVAPDAVVLSAGVWTPALAARAGLPVPVEPMRRFVHYVDVPVDLPVDVPVDVRRDLSRLPFVKDPDGLAFRPEGPGLEVGLVDFDQPSGFDLTIDSAHFDTRVWPALAHRVPALDSLRRRSTWAGLYDVNRLDGNMVIGNWPGHVDNVYLATGFSGHGLMHAPGVGRALAELVVHGEYRTLDLSRMGYQRVRDATAYAELGIR